MYKLCRDASHKLSV